MNRRGFLKALGLVPVAPILLKGMDFPAYAAEDPIPELDPIIEEYATTTGTILPIVGGDIPAGWLLCDGHTISVREYPKLCAVLGGGKLPNMLSWTQPVSTPGQHTHGMTPTVDYSSHRHSFSTMQYFVPFQYIIKA